MFRLIVLFLAVAFVLLLVAVRYLPWWGIALLVVGLYLLVRYVIPRLAVGLFLMPFKAKGAVLKNAVAEVHSVVWEAAPAKPAQHEPATPARAALEYDGTSEPSTEDEDEDDEPMDEPDEELEDEEPRDHFRIDVTITPQAKDGGFQHWEPSDLRLVPFTTKSGLNLKDEGDDQVGDTVEVEIFRDGRFEPDEEGKYCGPLRVRLLMAVPLDAPRRVKFGYYFELFGDLTLPVSGQIS